MLALAPVFFRRGPQSEYISLLSSTLAHAGLRDPRQRGRLLLARSEALAGAGRWDASTTDAEEAASAGRAAGDRWVEARALTRLGRSACFRGDDALAIELSRRAAELHAQDADPWEASAVGELGVALGNLGRLEDARRALERAVALARRSGQLFLEGFHQGNLAVALARVGARGDARRAFEQAILTMTLVDFAPIVAMNRSNLGLFLQEEGELDAALRCHDEALAQMGQTGFELLIARVRYSRASALHERGDFEEALVAYSEARLALMACSSPLEAAMPLAGSGAVSAALDRIDDAEAAFLLAEDELAHVSPETKAVVRVHRGHLHLARGRAHARQGDRAEAVREGREAVQAAGTAPPSKDRDEFRFAVRVLQRALRDAHLLADDTEPGSVFRIDALGRWFQPPRRDRVELRRRPNLQAILAHLVERARIAPGAPTSVAALLAAGWPGEKVIPKAGRARTHVAMSTLRKLGMREVLVNVDGGYLLDPAAVIVTPADEPVTS
jgi:tetratricopeptide (TPR) repeat protein